MYPLKKTKKLYSEIVKGDDLPDEVPITSVLGMSIAEEYGIQLKPGRKIQPDGNCLFTWLLDQMSRLVEINFYDTVYKEKM